MNVQVKKTVEDYSIEIRVEEIAKNDNPKVLVKELLNIFKGE